MKNIKLTVANMAKEYEPIPVLTLKIHIPIDESNVSKDKINRDTAKRILNYLEQSIKYYMNNTLSASELEALQTALLNKGSYCDYETDYLDPDSNSDL